MNDISSIIAITEVIIACFLRAIYLIVKVVI